MSEDAHIPNEPTDEKPECPAFETIGAPGRLNVIKYLDEAKREMSPSERLQEIKLEVAIDGFPSSAIILAHDFNWLCARIEHLEAALLGLITQIHLEYGNEFHALVTSKKEVYAAIDALEGRKP